MSTHRSSRQHGRDDADGPSASHRARLATSLALAVVVVVVYIPTLSNGFVDWDDEVYVVKNSHIQAFSGELVRWSVSTSRAANWHPLTWLSHALDWMLYGPWPGGHHLTSILLHAVNAVLLLLVVERLSGRLAIAAAVAAVFALHPLRVECVSWVSERKELLCALFFLLTILAYLRHRRAPGWRSYAAVMLLLAAALLSKPMAVTAPIVLLLLDWWPLRQLGWPRVIDKLPLLAMAAASSLVTLQVQAGGGAMRSVEQIGIGLRAANALDAGAGYLAKLAWPAPGSLLPLYTHPFYLPEGLPWARVALAAVALVLVSLIAASLRHRRPYVLMGWLWFVVTLVPVIGVVQVGVQRMADRYTYLPLIGPVMALVLLVGELSSGSRRLRRLAVCGLAVALVPLSALTVMQQSVWQSPTTLWEHTASGEPSSPIAHLHLADALHADGRDPWSAYRTAIVLDPGYADAHAALAARLSEVGDYESALYHYRRAIAIAPDDAPVRARLGNTLLSSGRTRDGTRELLRALAIAPHDPLILNSLARTMAAQGRLDRATAFNRLRLALDPSSAPAHNSLGITLILAGQIAEGVHHLRRAVDIDPSYASGHRNLARALELLGSDEQAPSGGSEQQPGRSPAVHDEQGSGSRGSR